MSVNENGNLRPDGLTLSWTSTIPRVGTVGVGGTYYWNSGSPTAPSATLTGMWGRGRDAWKIPLGPLGNLNLGAVFLRKGMTSADTLGYGTTSNVSTLIPSVSFNTSIPDINGIPQPAKGRESAIEAGVSGSIGTSKAGTYTVTLPQAADAPRFIRPAMGPDDELPPLFRMLQTGRATIGAPPAPPVPFPAPSRQKPLGDGMGDWTASAAPASSPPPLPPASQPREPGGSIAFDKGASPVMFPPPPNRPRGLPGMMTDAELFNPASPDQPPPGGLPGLLLDYLRNSRSDDASR